MNLKDWEFIKCLKQGNDWLILHFKWIREAKSGKQEDARKKPTHSSTLAWQIPWMEEPGRLQSMGSLKVRHDWATSLSLFTFMHWRRKWQPTTVFLPRESQGWGSLEGYCLWGRTRVGHDWSNLAAAAAAERSWGFPGGSSGKESDWLCRNLRDAGSIPGSGRSPGEGHGKNLVGYSLWGCTESDATEATWHACRKQPVAALKARNEEAVIPEKWTGLFKVWSWLAAKLASLPLLQHFFLPTNLLFTT